jgi:uncharacterized membrane protein
MASQTDSATPTKGTTQPPRGVPKINTVTAEDIRASLRAGFSDFLARPVMSSFFGLFYALFGILLVWGLVWLGQIWMIIPAVVAFPLVAPFAAAGLYEMSRRLQRNESFGWSDILTVMADQRKREMAVDGLRHAVHSLGVVLPDPPLARDHPAGRVLLGFRRLFDAVFFTAEGWTFLAIGTLVGAGLSAVLFAVTVVAMPLLLDRETDFVTAMLTSLRSVAANPVVMLTWAAIISVTMLLSLVPAFLGLIFTLPILGHTTWHLYQRVVPPTEG